MSAYLTFIAAASIIIAPPALAGAPKSTTLAQAEWVATGGDAWDNIRAIQLSGTIVAGGAPGRFTKLVDLQNGHSITTFDGGSFHDVSGFDGVAWDEANGILNVTDLPPLVSDARSQAFLQSLGWHDPDAIGAPLAPSPLFKDQDGVRYRPLGGSPVDLWFDQSTHLLRQAVIYADGGHVTTVCTDWRSISGVLIPFHQLQTDATGSETELIVNSAQPESNRCDPAFARPTPRQHGKMTAGSSSTIRFEFTKFNYGHIVIPTAINGVPTKLTFDTGATNYLSPTAAHRLGLKIGGGVSIESTGESSEAGGYAHVMQLAIGRAQLTDETIIVGPLPYVALHPRAHLDADGLTGMEFLSEFRVTIDYASRLLTLAAFSSPRPPGGVILPFWSDGQTPFVEASVNGVRGLFRLDTGDAGSVTLFGEFARTHGLLPNRAANGTTTAGPDYSVVKREVVLKRFLIAGRDFKELPGEVIDTRAGAFASHALAGNIGESLLRNFRITFDYRSRTVSLEPYSNVPTPVAPDRSGLTLTQTAPDSILVLGVEPGSPAAIAGLRQGDVITAVDGMSVRDDNLGKFDLTQLASQHLPLRLTTSRSGQLTIQLDPERRGIR